MGEAIDKERSKYFNKLRDYITHFHSPSYTTTQHLSTSHQFIQWAEPYMCSTLLYSSYEIRHALHIAIFFKGELEVQVFVFVLNIEELPVNNLDV